MLSWAVSAHFTGTSSHSFHLEVTPLMLGFFAYKAAALIQAYRDNKDLLLIIATGDLDSVETAICMIPSIISLIAHFFLMPLSFLKGILDSIQGECSCGLEELCSLLRWIGTTFLFLADSF